MNRGELVELPLQLDQFEENGSMSQRTYFDEEAKRLETSAREDDVRAGNLREINAMLASYYERRARWRRYLAQDARQFGEMWPDEEN